MAEKEQNLEWWGQQTTKIQEATRQNLQRAKEEYEEPMRRPPAPLADGPDRRGGGQEEEGPHPLLQASRKGSSERRILMTITPLIHISLHLRQT